MRFDWVIPCRDVEFRDGGVHISHGGINCIRVPKLPIRVSFIVLLRLVGLVQDFDEHAPRNIEAYVNGPDGEALFDLQFEVPSGGPSDSYQPGWELVAYMPVGVRFTPTQVGYHELNFYLQTDRPKTQLDRERKRYLPLMIKLIDSN